MKYTAEQALSFFRSVIKSGEFWNEECDEAYESAMACLEAREGQEPKAWLIEYERNGHSYKVAQMHNCIADYRDFDRHATSTPLYASVPLD